MGRFILVIGFILAVGAIFPSSGRAALRGSLEWGYQRTLLSEQGEGDRRSSDFTQQYEVQYDKKGLFYGGRAGSYNYSLGYQWLGIAGSAGSEDFSANDGKYIYRGDVVIAPVALPFKLHAFSQDLARGRIVRETGRLTDSKNRESLVGVNNTGQRVRTGLNLEAGIRNGSYLGRYRTNLSKIPKLYIDYVEDYVKDLESLSPEHYRTRKLAFVSLNKVDNWLHYRFTEHRDFINPLSDRDERSYQLGTIDHKRRRRWVNLTNWIRVSTDATYSTENYADPDSADISKYDLNLFSRFRGRKWNASTFSSLDRSSDQFGNVNRDIDIPLFASGELTPDTSWRIASTVQRQDEIAGILNKDSSRDVLDLSFQLNSFRRARLSVQTRASLSIVQSDVSSRRLLSLEGDVKTNSRPRPRFHQILRYKLEHSERKSELETLRDGLRAGVTYSLRSTGTSGMRYGGEQEFHFEQKGFGAEGASDEKLSKTSAHLEFMTASKTRHRIEGEYVFARTGDSDVQGMTLSHSLSRTIRAFGFDSSTSFDYTKGDEDGTYRSLVHESNVKYAPSPVWDISGNAQYELESSRGGIVSRQGESPSSQQGKSTLLSISENLAYRFFDRSGFARKLGELRQKLEIVRTTVGIMPARRSLVFSLMGDYYPTRVLVLKSGFDYSLETPSDADVLGLFFSAGLNYTKLQVAFSYEYLVTDSPDSPESTESRWDVNVRKIF